MGIPSGAREVAACCGARAGRVSAFVALLVRALQSACKGGGAVRKPGRSKCGWLFSFGYFAVASMLFYQANTCSGWVCDLVALPAAFPLGFPIAWLTDWVDSWFSIPGHTPSFHFRNWYFIVPTLIANSIAYYWLGKLIAVVTHRVWSGREGSGRSTR